MIQKQNQNEQWMLLVLLLKEIAGQKSISINEIAEKANMEQSSVSRFFSLKFKPTLHTFLEIAKAIGVNFFFQDQNGKSDLNTAMERAMDQLGRRIEKLPKN
jgi:DNA-binding phage protein